MKELLFKNYVFRDGTNLTVRRGNRVDQLKSGTEICLKPSDRSANRKAMLGNLICKLFREITAWEIQFEHDPNCQTYGGLLKVMKEFYPGFKENEYVTLVFFMPMKTL